MTVVKCLKRKERAKSSTVLSDLVDTCMIYQLPRIQSSNPTSLDKEPIQESLDQVLEALLVVMLVIFRIVNNKCRDHNCNHSYSAGKANQFNYKVKALDARGKKP